jgi:flavin reductase (DIM6/NTAB) family NADH-FMN oxidoreductase RutF
LAFHLRQSLRFTFWRHADARRRQSPLLRTIQGPRARARPVQGDRRSAADRLGLTRGADGSINLAPYCFFNAFNYTSPIIGFSSTSPKDPLHNVQETGEFVWNMMTRDLAEQMNHSCAAVPHGTNESRLAGLTQVPSRLVNVPRVAESPVSFECKVVEIIQLKGHKGDLAQAGLTLGEVVAVHIAKHLLTDGVFDTFSANIVLRARGPSAYARTGPKPGSTCSGPGEIQSNNRRSPGCKSALKWDPGWKRDRPDIGGIMPLWQKPGPH